MKLTYEQFQDELFQVFPGAEFICNDRGSQYNGVLSEYHKLGITVYYLTNTELFTVDVTTSNYKFGTATDNNLKVALNEAIIDLSVNIASPDEDW